MVSIATRREKVVLTLDDDFTPGMAKAAATTALLNRELGNLSGQSVRADRSTQMFVRDLGALNRESRGAERSINQLTGRLRLFADAAAIFGPGLTPIGGVLAAGVAGFASQLGFAAIGAGVLIGSMQGLGGALEAMNKAQLEPTDANLEKMRDSLRALSPAARDFAKEAFALKPALVSIRDLGAEELFPGLSESLNNLERLGPQVGAIFSAIAGAAGEIAADSTASLAGDRWAEFFTFVETEAPQALKEMSSALGDFTHGLAELWMAFEPLNSSFSGWLMDVANGFDAWASGLSATEGFTEFVDYIRETGPQVADTLGSLFNALVQIVQATAPLGGPVLAGIEAFANVLGSIADSDIGTPLLAGVAALALYNRTLSATAAVQARVNAGGGLFGMIGTRQSAVSGSFAAVRKDVEMLGSAWATAGARTAREQQRMAAGTASLRGNLSGLASQSAKAAAPIAGVGIAASGAADKVGLTNTASLALMGTLAGPWGAAVGGAIGLMLDWRSATEVAADAQETFEARLKGMSMADLNAELERSKLLATRPGFDEEEGAASRERAVDAIKAQIDETHRLETAQEVQNRAAVVAYASQVGLNVKLSEISRRSTEDIKAQAEALEAVNKEGLATAESFGMFGDSLNDAKVSLGDFITDMQQTADAMVNFNTNSRKAVKNGLDDGLVVSLRKAGEEGALRMKQLANASESEIARANKAFRSHEKAIEKTLETTRDLAGMSPVAVDFKAETNPAMRNIEALEARLRGIKDEDVFINVRQIGSTTLGPRNEAADGVTVPKTGKPYADRHLYLLADGEEVISNRHGQADKHRPLLKAINGGLAGGGTAGKKGKHKGGFFDLGNNTGPGEQAQQQAAEAAEAFYAEQDRARRDAERRAEHESKMFLAAIEGQERAAQGLIDAAEEQKSAAESVRDGWAQAMERTGSAATAGFRTDLFGSQQRGLWSGPGGASGSSWRDALLGDISGLQERGNLVQVLSGQGIKGSALEALLGQGNNAQIMELINSGQAGDFAALFAQREALQTSVSTQAGQAAYGAEFAAAASSVAALGSQILVLQQQLAAITAQRPITVYEAYSAQATAAEVARLQGTYGAA